MSASERLLTEWDILYDTQIDKIADELEGNDHFSPGSGDYIREAIKHGEGNDALYEYEALPQAEKDAKDRSIVEEWVRERWADFESDFSNKAEDENGMLKVSRCIAVPDAEEFLFFVANESPLPEYKGLGVYWAWDKDRAECHWRGRNGGGADDVLVHALVPFESIDVFQTLLANLSPSTGREEAEIYLKEGAKIFVTAVDLKQLDEHVEAPEPIQMTASAGPYRYHAILRVFTRS